MASGLLKLEINWENGSDVSISWHYIIKFFWRCFVSLVNFSYWSKFHVSIITGSGVMAILFNKRLGRNLEIGNTPVWVLPNICRLGQVRDTKFGMNISSKILLNAAKCQGYTFYRFWVIKGKPTEVGVKLLPSAPPTRIRVKETWFIFFAIMHFLICKFLKQSKFSKMQAFILITEKLCSVCNDCCI